MVSRTGAYNKFKLAGSGILPNGIPGSAYNTNTAKGVAKGPSRARREKSHKFQNGSTVEQGLLSKALRS